jgi:uncharacterized protein DUF2442
VVANACVAAGQDRVAPRVEDHLLAILAPAAALGDYRNGWPGAFEPDRETAGDVDLSYLSEYGGVFEPLKDPDYFRKLRADEEAGTIVWPNDADIAPETLYSRARRLTTTAA